MRAKRMLRRLWCRLFHFKYWAGTTHPDQVQGRFLWVRCARCRESYSFKIAIPAKAPVGRTPL